MKCIQKYTGYYVGVCHCLGQCINVITSSIGVPYLFTSLNDRFDVASKFHL